MKEKNDVLNNSEKTWDEDILFVIKTGFAFLIGTVIGVLIQTLEQSIFNNIKNLISCNVV